METKSTTHFLDLHPDIVAQTVKLLDLPSAFLLSTTSTKAKKAVASARLAIRYLRVELTETPAFIVHSADRRMGITWGFETEHFRKADMAGLQDMEVVIDGLEFQTGKVEQSSESNKEPFMEFYTISEDPNLAMKQILTFMFEVFAEPRETKIEFSTSEYDDVVELSEWSVSRNAKIFLIDGYLSNENMTFFLRNFLFTDLYLNDFRSAKDFKYDRKIVATRMFQGHTTWITLLNILNIECPNIFLYNAKKELRCEEAFHEGQLRDIFKYWKKGTHLRRLQLMILQDVSGYSKKWLSEGLNPQRMTRFDEEERQDFDLYKKHIGFDIFRDDDGVKATVAFDQQRLVFRVYM